MKQQYAQEWPQFFTATIQEWKHLLKGDKYKNIIVDTFRFLTREEKVTINGFVIMSNHLHIIWQSKGSDSIQKIQNSFIKHTSLPSLVNWQSDVYPSPTNVRRRGVVFDQPTIFNLATAALLSNQKCFIFNK